MRDRCTIIAWNVSLSRNDGGGRRTTAFIEAIEKLGVATEIVPVGPSAAETDRRVNESRLHAVKRRFLPLPLRGSVTADLNSRQVRGNIISLVSGAHGYAVANGSRVWIDYSDLWSQYSGDTARRWTSRVEIATRQIQSRMWSRQENVECSSATAVTMAGYTDASLMSRYNAMWIPVPIVESLAAKAVDPLAPRRDSGKGYVRAGFLANFGYPPNREAYFLLLNYWLPALRERNISIAVAGFGSDSLPPAQGIHILGPVNDLDQFYNDVDVILVPVAAGGGMKVKVVEAMLNGKRVIGSPHAFENLPDVLVSAGTVWNTFLRESEVDLSDPRGEPTVRECLDRFTSYDFDSRVAEIWRSRMSGGQGA